ncbi:Putative zinc transporter msc2 [Malassezia brasiliensis]|uniref:Zinc transporter msc2 n=1 Tax=Malassezia brasiliensis TaxID=1821822 RepID=A0AAF0DTQ0_9BASI|nr:Putative zinc transporter msc2 [Malassezia brasiliensis]
MIRAILANSDSRRIFLFLCLNLAFMGVQMLWGVWTNSLGLISDAIHMFFDCAAIFMGLIASVMASWKTDDRFHYGYKRVETLSGFANGIFLVLISVFILFEAVQRIIEPPVMNNMTQLLVVSTLGLLVNLFGMFAMVMTMDMITNIATHVMADTLGSVGVIISTILIHYFHWTGFDPIASLLIGLMILGSVVPLPMINVPVEDGDIYEVHIESLINIANDLKQHGVEKVVLACGKDTPYSAAVFIHPSLIVPEDAKSLTVPIALFTSIEEDNDAIKSFRSNVQANPATSSSFVSNHYGDINHGFAGARANFEDPKNVERFKDVYERTAKFLVQHLQ